MVQISAWKASNQQQTEPVACQNSYYLLNSRKHKEFLDGRWLIIEVFLQTGFPGFGGFNGGHVNNHRAVPERPHVSMFPARCFSRLQNLSNW